MKVYLLALDEQNNEYYSVFSTKEKAHKAFTKVYEQIMSDKMVVYDKIKRWVDDDYVVIELYYDHCFVGMDVIYVAELELDNTFEIEL